MGLPENIMNPNGLVSQKFLRDFIAYARCSIHTYVLYIHKHTYILTLISIQFAMSSQYVLTYIHIFRNNVYPEISPAAEEILVESYLTMRAAGTVCMGMYVCMYV